MRVVATQAFFYKGSRLVKRGESFDASHDVAVACPGLFEPAGDTDRSEAATGVEAAVTKPRSTRKPRARKPKAAE